MSCKLKITFRLLCKKVILFLCVLRGTDVERGRKGVYALLVVLLLSACSAQVPSWRSRTEPLVAVLGQMDAPRLFPQEYKSVLETFEHGDALYHVRDDHEGADGYYRLAFQKAAVLQTEIQQVLNQAAEQQNAMETAVKTAEEKLKHAAKEAERLKEQQAIIASETARSALKKAKEASQPLPTSYTVRRGETLPQISARSEIYNDATLWPIIYRANRDQIRDPKRLWPGQVFTIPRNFSRDDAVDRHRAAGLDPHEDLAVSDDRLRPIFETQVGIAVIHRNAHIILYNIFCRDDVTKSPS